MSYDILQMLHSDEKYVDKVFKEMILPIRDELLKQVGFELRPYQRQFSDRIIKAVLRANNEEIAALMSRQVGKTETLADTVLTLFLFFLNVPIPFRVGWFAPAQSQSTLIARKRVTERQRDAKELFDDLGVHVVRGYGQKRVGRTSPLLIFRNDELDIEGHVRSMSANPMSNIKGETLDLVILEEAQEIDKDKMMTDIYPMTSKGSPVVLVGTPIPSLVAMNDYFIETVTKNPRNAYLMTVDWRRVCAYDENYPEELKAYENGTDVYRGFLDSYRHHIEAEKKRLTDEAFQSQYELKWFAGVHKLITWDEILDLEQDYTSDKERLRFWGLDTAKIADSTVGTVLERYLGKYHIVGLFERQGTDYPTQAIEFIEWLKKFQPLRYGFIDSTGGGEAFIDLIRKDLFKLSYYDPFNFSARADVNRMFQTFCMDLRHQKIHYSKENVDKRLLNSLMEQLSTVNRVYHGHYLWLESTGKEHDDYIHSLALAHYAGI